MLDNKTKIIVGIAVVAVIGVVVFMVMRKKGTREGFLGNLPRFSAVVQREVAADQQAAAKGQFYSVPGFQGILAPRAASVNYGANIKHNMPAYENQGIPCNPLTFGNMAYGADWGGTFNTTPQAAGSCASIAAAQNSAKQHGGVKEGFKDMTRENYGCGGGCGSGCTPASCNTDGTPYQYHGGAPLMPADYTDGNYAEVLDDVMRTGEYADNSGTLPVPSMATVDALGQVSEQPIIQDRLVMVNAVNRLQGLGDKIRGDLQITPQQFGWFNSSWGYAPVSTISQGALGVITDVDNGNFHRMAEFINSTSGSSTIAGADISTMKESQLGFGQNDLSVTAFP